MLAVISISASAPADAAAPTSDPYPSPPLLPTVMSRVAAVCTLCAFVALARAVRAVQQWHAHRCVGLIETITLMCATLIVFSVMVEFSVFSHNSYLFLFAKIHVREYIVSHSLLLGPLVTLTQRKS